MSKYIVIYYVNHVCYSFSSFDYSLSYNFYQKQILKGRVAKLFLQLNLFGGD